MSEYIFRTDEPIEYCYECPLNNQENGQCRLGVETSGCEVPKKCTLVELPEHGRLGDLDKVADDISSRSDKARNKNDDYIAKGFMFSAMIVRNAPTIIEANEVKK